MNWVGALCFAALILCGTLLDGNNSGDTATTSEVTYGAR